MTRTEVSIVSFILLENQFKLYKFKAYLKRKILNQNFWKSFLKINHSNNIAMGATFGYAVRNSRGEKVYTAVDCNI